MESFSQSPDGRPSAPDHVTFPHLRRLRVTLRKGVDDKKLIQILSSGSGQSILESGSLEVGNPASFGLILAHMPCITELQLAVAEGFPHTLDDIAPPLASDILPQLERLQIEDPPDYPAGCDALVRMLHARRDATVSGHAVLRSFILVLSRSRSADLVPFASLSKRRGVESLEITIQGNGVMLTTGGKLNMMDNSAVTVSVVPYSSLEPRDGSAVPALRWLAGSENRYRKIQDDSAPEVMLGPPLGSDFPQVHGIDRHELTLIN
ncbi:hypothetical protein B0H17DRAFT_1133922 [Mycena rosella]|uniref:Uncharacterized protein n=1 Tax=Mycena rosella TaxID=1033263 RepID=A0AAD7GIV7_MYCRO|nr:hypothetical protein B0H17DRAFT_1133922 [Mycena rosella]